MSQASLHSVLLGHHLAAHASACKLLWSGAALAVRGV